uniref:Uncharacterized protein n=1 Tax=Eutreptiella gymnastica TaxID=73025 RepID=A0A7S4CDQ2_9EUGL
MTTGLSSDCDACLPGYTGHDPNTKCLCRGANCYSVAYDPTKAYPTPDTPISFALDEGNLSVYVDYKAGALGPVSTSFQIQPVTLDQVLHPSKSAPMAQIYVGPSAFYLRSLTPDQTAPQHGKFALQALTDVTLQLKVPYPDVSVAKAGASWLDALKIDYAVHPPVLLWRSPDGWTPAHDTCKTPEADKMISQLLQTTICRLEDEMQFSLFVKVSDTFPWWVYFSVGAVLVAVLLIIMSIVLCYRRRVGNERAKAEAKARVIAYLTQNKNKMGKSLRRRLGLSSSQKFTPEMAAQRFLQKHDKVQKMIARMNKPAERRRSLMLPPGGSMEVGSRPEMSSIESLQMITDAQMVGETWQFQPHEVALLEACTKLRSLFRQDPFTKEYALKPSAFPEMQQKLLLLQMENDKLKKVIGSHNPGVVYPRM